MTSLMARIYAGWGALVRLLAVLLTGISWLTAHAIGRWQWQAPAWLAWIGHQLGRSRRYLAADPKRAGILLLALASVSGGYIWYKNRPKPHFVEYTITAPALTEYNDSGIASIKSLKIDFSEAAAPLRQ